MSVTFIGDVHGWPDRLAAVLAQAEGEPVLMGDLIDRGPDTPAVLDHVRALVEDGRARCLLGNHEYALLRGLGAAELGLEPDPVWFDLWRDRHGGRSVLRDYRADDAASLRQAMGAPLLDWLARLPWCLEGPGWLAVHAALRQDQPLAEQLLYLRDGWRHLLHEPDHLYEKPGVPLDHPELPAGTVLVSGHLPLPEPLITARRILCDTSGGLPGRQLSGVVWPGGRIVRSA
jgi:serine/threonine protein phosphatase 1